MVDPIDAKNGNTLWADAISEVMNDVRVAFKILPDGKPVPIGHQFVQCHMVFDIKMEDFRRKARLVAGGYMTKTLATIMYASVVSKETVRIALMICTLNDLKVKLGHIMIAYVQVSMTEKMLTTLSPEFSKDAARLAMIVRAFYGLQLAGTAF